MLFKNEYERFRGEKTTCNVKIIGILKNGNNIALVFKHTCLSHRFVNTHVKMSIILKSAPIRSVIRENSWAGGCMLSEDG